MITCLDSAFSIPTRPAVVLCDEHIYAVPFPHLCILLRLVSLCITGDSDTGDDLDLIGLYDFIPQHLLLYEFTTTFRLAYHMN